MKQREGDQPLPVLNDSTDIQTLVIADIHARRELGISRYGSALQAHNGRDALRDAYEEAMDLTMYLKQALVEREEDACTAEPSPNADPALTALSRLVRDPKGYFDDVRAQAERNAAGVLKRRSTSDNKSRSNPVQTNDALLENVPGAVQFTERLSALEQTVAKLRDALTDIVTRPQRDAERQPEPDKRRGAHTYLANGEPVYADSGAVVGQPEPHPDAAWRERVDALSSAGRATLRGDYEVCIREPLVIDRIAYLDSLAEPVPGYDPATGVYTLEDFDRAFLDSCSDPRAVAEDHENYAINEVDQADRAYYRACADYLRARPDKQND